MQPTASNPAAGNKPMDRPKTAGGLWLRLIFQVGLLYVVSTGYFPSQPNYCIVFVYAMKNCFLLSWWEYHTLYASEVRNIFVVGLLGYINSQNDLQGRSRS